MTIFLTLPAGTSVLDAIASLDAEVRRRTGRTLDHLVRDEWALSIATDWRTRQTWASLRSPKPVETDAGDLPEAFPDFLAEIAGKGPDNPRADRPASDGMVA